MTDAERRARCAWICYQNDRIDGSDGLDDGERLREVRETDLGLSPEEKEAHLRWVKQLDRALEDTLQRFCPGGECCDQEHWGRQARLAVLRLHRGPERPSERDLGLFESVGRLLGQLAPKERVRILIACVAAHSAEAGAEAEDTADVLRIAARRYQDRLEALPKDGGRALSDGGALLGFAFPEELP